MSDDKVNKKRYNNRVQNMNSDRINKKRKADQTENIPLKRFYKKHKTECIEYANEQYNDNGDMTEECKHCKALYWKNEKLRNNCYHGGKVKLPKLSKYNENLKDLLLDRKFRDLIRYYNSEYSFVTFVTKDLDHNNEKGI